MKLAVECTKCEQATEIDLSEAIRILIEAAERKSIWAGFLCADCAETDDED